MEEQARAQCDQILSEAMATADAVLHGLSLARSLIVNPSTSEVTISSLFETLSRSLRPDGDPVSIVHTLSLLSDLAAQRPHLSRSVFHAIRSFSLLSNHISTRVLAAALSALASIADSDQSLISELDEFSESLFLTLCFRPNVPVRRWLLLNAEKLRVRPHLLLTIFLGFTKDPYPYVRKVALNGLVSLCKSIVVEDPSLMESCYCRAVELLSDMEDCVRSAAVRVVSRWGQLIVALNDGNDKKESSDVLFIQLCSMVRDMSMTVRVEAFDALGKIGMVSEDVLMQTLSKKVLPVNKEKTYCGMGFAKPFEIPVSNAAGTFVHGLEDEFCEVRRSASHSLHTLSVLSTSFAGEALTLLMDVLNDDSMAVRLQALDTIHCMALFGHLKVEEAHMHMFLSTLVDTSAVVRSAARKVLRATKLNDMPMFRISVDGLLENLEMYPQDEADILSVLFSIGRTHGNFAAEVIKEVFGEIEPSSDGKLSFDSGKVAALLVLAISVPLAHEQCAGSIPSITFSYAVTLLGRISHALSDIMDQNTLLAYLSHCSRSTVISASEFLLEKGESVLAADMHLEQSRGETCGIHVQKTQVQEKVAAAVIDDKVWDYDEATKLVQLVIQKLNDIWQLIQFGWTSEMLKTLRNWKEELTTFTNGSSASIVAFMLQYLKILKLLAKIWLHFFSLRKFCSFGLGELGLLMAKLDKTLREVRYRFIGLSKHEELHVLELSLLNYTLSLSSVEACHDCATIKKLSSMLSQVEFLYQEIALEPSEFVTELKKSLHELDFSSDGIYYFPFLFQTGFLLV
ncbi:hypothetical protein NMG60_11000117 [Bertholletia excelsa]